MWAAGGMSRECRNFYTCLSEMIIEKRDTNYSMTATWIRMKLTFSVIKFISLCTHGSRSTFSSNRLKKLIDEDANTIELRIP